MKAFIGDFVIVTASEKYNTIPGGTPLKVIAIEDNPKENGASWKNCPEEIIKDNEPFYILETPLVSLEKNKMGLSFVKIADCKKYDEEKPVTVRFEILENTEILTENKDEDWQQSEWDDNSIFFSLD